MTSIHTQTYPFHHLQTQFITLLQTQAHLNQSQINKSQINQPQSLNHWYQIEKNYGETHRHYHTLSHIDSMYAQFNHIQHLLHDHTSVAFAIFYHDIIYDPTKTDNEARSCELFVDQLGSVLPKALINQVTAMIMMTQQHQLKHQPKYPLPHQQTPQLAKSMANHPNHSDAAYFLDDTAFFLDIDLSILGQASSIYQTYAHAIRQEYAHVSTRDYCQGRIHVLQSFLKRPRLYFSEYFYEQYEEPARQNLTQEIESLRSI